MHNIKAHYVCATFVYWLVYYAIRKEFLKVLAKFLSWGRTKGKPKTNVFQK